MLGQLFTQHAALTREQARHHPALRAKLTDPPRQHHLVTAERAAAVDQQPAALRRWLVRHVRRRGRAALIQELTIQFRQPSPSFLPRKVRARTARHSRFDPQQRVRQRFTDIDIGPVLFVLDCEHARTSEAGHAGLIFEDQFGEARRRHD
jgi:hypothetical protein